MQRRPEPRGGPYDRPRGQGQASSSCSIDAPLLTAKLKQAHCVDELLHLVGEHGDAFNHIHCSAAWSYLGKQAGECSKPQHQAGLGRLLRLTEARVPACEARNMSTTVHGVAKSRVSGTRGLFAAVAAAAVPRVRDFNPQNLANTVWAYATAGHSAPALLDAIAAAAPPRLREFKPQEFANMAWAYATAGQKAPALFDAIMVEVAPRLRDFTPQDMANTALAYATAGHSAPALLDAIAAAALPRMGNFEPQALANMAWAFATAGHEAPELLDAIAAAAMSRVRDFKPQVLDNMAWAYARAGHEAPALIGALRDGGEGREGGGRGGDASGDEVGEAAVD